MKNRSGKFATPGARGILARRLAATEAGQGRTRSRSSTRRSKKYPNAYPISTFTYVDRAGELRRKAADLRALHLLGGHEGPAQLRSTAAPVFAPLPKLGRSSSPRRRSRRSSRTRASELREPSTQPRMRPAAPSRGGGSASGDLILQVVAGARGARRRRARRPDRLEGDRGRAAVALDVRAQLRHDASPGTRSIGHEFGAGSFLFGTVDHLASAR